ncbi:OLC1v1030426C1 [Oldenlandia corymbosa var. corymbosa]|uniref:OLC1v1030426C1 n=1 Tax=Oldenlandia corymbosa var. corymbosa TaxID=529605 RepID=A0AAV1CG48_OLDCO|nr:OLC1v1030426C1 [Oldenlandia corymbosa var. corymbosa]
MKLDIRKEDIGSSSARSLDGSFRKPRSDAQNNDVESSSGRSLDGSFRKPRSVASVPAASINSKTFVPASEVYKVIKECASRLVDQNLFTQYLEDWVLDNLHSHKNNGEIHPHSPFQVDEICSLDLALEGVLFQQMFRMPFSSPDAEGLREDELLALDDLLRTMAEGLWHTFWHRNKPMPFHVSFARYPGSKFYTIEKATSKGRLNELSGAALISKTGGKLRSRWHDVILCSLLKDNIMMGDEYCFSSIVACEALFYAVHILLARSLSKGNTVRNECVFILVLDSKLGGVIKLGGDLGNLEMDLNNPYQSVAEWIKCHAEVCFSPIEQVWNKLGNVNWRDLGTLQLLLASFHSIAQCVGPPRKSIDSLASNHILRLHQRRIECRLAENDSYLVSPHDEDHHQEIAEIESHNNQNLNRQERLVKLNEDEILVIEDRHLQQRSFQIQGSLAQGISSYVAVSLDNPTELLTLYVGAHTSRLEPSWEDMSLWYQVQRQTKVLNIFKEQGITSKFLPEVIASGRILHSGPCEKQSPKGCCDHPSCGTPVLVTYPVGEMLSSIVAQHGPFSAEEAIRCCRDCLAALRSAKMANIQHGDICPEHIICAVDRTRCSCLYILVSWGRAILEDKDTAPINLQFSSSYALQNGKLCPSSDAESLVYLMYFICGGSMKQQDSIESALHWKQRCWGKRVIQQRLGEVSPVLKAFADYIDSLCGTPYPVDYDTWLKRLSRAVDNSADRGKTIDVALNTQDMGESSGTSGGGNSSTC